MSLSRFFIATPAAPASSARPAVPFLLRPPAAPDLSGLRRVAMVGTRDDAGRRAPPGR
jgi:hypothetical protein